MKKTILTICTMLFTSMLFAQTDIISQLSQLLNEFENSDLVEQKGNDPLLKTYYSLRGFSQIASNVNLSVVKTENINSNKTTIYLLITITINQRYYYCYIEEDEIDALIQCATYFQDNLQSTKPSNNTELIYRFKQGGEINFRYKSGWEIQLETRLSPTITMGIGNFANLRKAFEDAKIKILELQNQ